MTVDCAQHGCTHQWAAHSSAEWSHVCKQGTAPSVSKLMALRTMLLSSTDPCAPTNLENCFMSASGISEDSARGLTSLLQVGLAPLLLQPMCVARIGAECTAEQRCPICVSWNAC